MGSTFLEWFYFIYQGNPSILAKGRPMQELHAHEDQCDSLPERLRSAVTCCHPVERHRNTAKKLGATNWTNTDTSRSASVPLQGILGACGLEAIACLGKPSPTGPQLRYPSGRTEMRLVSVYKNPEKGTPRKIHTHTPRDFECSSSAGHSRGAHPTGRGGPAPSLG